MKLHPLTCPVQIGRMISLLLLLARRLALTRIGLKLLICTIWLCLTLIFIRLHDNITGSRKLHGR